MCHDINPLGTTMHLRELDRQAARNRGPLLPSIGYISLLIAFSHGAASFIAKCAALSKRPRPAQQL